ncbi:MAG: hypothetical protein IJ007_01600 [Oscillospiraceae bacterium]|nr:hypothetical protein [Oscillospiraceae bacterium]
MRESLLTIPISEIFEPREGCPMCRLRDMLETRTVEYIMGAAMMEPDVRIETNKLGFCGTHLRQMMKQKNRLSLALMLQTHIESVHTELFTRKKLFEPKNARAQRLSRINETCFVCSKIDWGMERLMRTFFEMYSSAEFRQLLSEQEYICLPHFDLLMSLAPVYLKKGELTAFEKDIGRLVELHIGKLYEDVSHYCNMYDYRNTGKDADWGNSKDSIERSVKFLTGRETE